MGRETFSLAIAWQDLWLGGRIYDLVNSYSMVWILAILLGVAAAILHLPITDQPFKIGGALEPSAD